MAVKAYSIIFILSPVTCHICGAPSLRRIKVSVIRTLYCRGSPTITSIVGITWPCAELIISIRLLRAVWKTSIGCDGIWYCKPLGAGSVVWIGLCSPNQVDWTFTLLYQSFTVATNKIFVGSIWVLKQTIRWYSTYSCSIRSTSFYITASVLFVQVITCKRLMEYIEEKISFNR